MVIHRIAREKYVKPLFCVNTLFIYFFIIQAFHMLCYLELLDECYLSSSSSIDEETFDWFDFMNWFIIFAWQCQVSTVGVIVKLKEKIRIFYDLFDVCNKIILTFSLKVLMNLFKSCNQIPMILNL